MSHRRRKYPYYKVQFFDAKSQTWMEKKKTFDTVLECKEFIGKRLQVCRRELYTSTARGITSSMNEMTVCQIGKVFSVHARLPMLFVDYALDAARR